MIGIRGFAGALGARIPVDPDAPEARRWLREELAKAPYQAARPNWFDRFSKDFLDWIRSLTAPTGDGLGSWTPVILTLVAVGVIVAAFLIFGLPRINRRSRLPAELFGKDDRRSAEDMRRAAETAASVRDWSLATEELFRAMARGLVERTVLVVTPGTTAHAFAARAAAAFPAEHDRLAAAATAFDGVRYLGVAGTERDYRAMSSLESGLRGAQPVLLEHPVLAADA